jgi:hypothetical protein
MNNDLKRSNIQEVPALSESGHAARVARIAIVALADLRARAVVRR